MNSLAYAPAFLLNSTSVPGETYPLLCIFLNHHDVGPGSMSHVERAELGKGTACSRLSYRFHLSDR